MKAAHAKRLGLWQRFAEAYIAKAENATQAYLEVKPHVTVLTAGVEGHKLLKIPKVQKLIEQRREELRRRFALTTDRVIQELARVSYFNPKRLVDEHGRAIPLHRLDDDTAAALAAIEITETTVQGKGRSKVVITRTTKGRPFNKTPALDKSIKILRLYDKPPPPSPEAEEELPDVRETARRMAFLLARGAAAATAARSHKSPPRRRRLRVTAEG